MRGRERRERSVCVTVAQYGRVRGVAFKTG